MKNETEQFFKMPHSLSSNPKLKDGDKLTLALIKSWIDNDQECFMSNQYIGNVLGCSGTAASKRIQKLKNLGCIELRYEYVEGKKEVEKRYITFISFEPQVSPDELEGISSETIGISSQEIGYVLTDDGVSPDGQGEVSPEVGGIIQSSLLDNLLNNELDNLSNNGLNNEIKNILHQTTGAVVNGFNLKRKIKELILNDCSKYFPTDSNWLFKWIEQDEFNKIKNRIGDISDNQMVLFTWCRDVDVLIDYPTEELPELLQQYVK